VLIRNVVYLNLIGNNDRFVDGAHVNLERVITMIISKATQFS